MSILNDPGRRHNPPIEAELADGWNPPDAEPWGDESADDPLGWLPVDHWFDRQAEIFEAEGGELADHVATWLRAEAKAFRALDATTLAEYIARAETYES